jgi:hypothetical protein
LNLCDVASGLAACASPAVSGPVESSSPASTGVTANYIPMFPVHSPSPETQAQYLEIAAVEARAA